MTAVPAATTSGVSRSLERLDPPGRYARSMPPGRQRVALPCQRVALPYRPPYDWPALIAFLSARATPGVEAVSADAYRRTVAINGEAGVVEVRRVDGSATVELWAPGSSLETPIIDRVRHLLDLDSDPAMVAAHFAGDSLLAPRLAAHPGIRVPGAWDGFELAVRAILGQQVSVRAATTLAGRVAQAFGTPLPAEGELSRLFPSADRLMDAHLEPCGVMPSRAASIRALARAVVEGRIEFEAGHPRASAEALMAVPGIGPWTASYIAMRALGDRDAFPAGDLVLRKAAGGCTARALDERSRVWRPWRAYAVMLLWQDVSAEDGAAGTR